MLKLKTITLLTVVSIFSVCASAEKKSYNGYKIIQMKNCNYDCYNELREKFPRMDLLSHNPPHFMTSDLNYQQVQEFFDINNLDYEVVVSNVQDLIDLEAREIMMSAKSLKRYKRMSIIRFAKTPVIEYFQNFTEIQRSMKKVVEENSELLQEVVLGYSYEKRIINAIKVNFNESNKKIFVNCGTHAREWVGPAACMGIIDKLVEVYGQKNHSLHSTFNRISFVVLPVMNPDGYVYSWTKERMWRKTRSHSDTRKGNCIGADPNRNFPTAWELNEQSSSKPCDYQTYKGDSKLSEPCTKALHDYMDELSDVKAFVDFHSYGKLILIPLSYTDNATKYDNITRKAAGNMAEMIKSEGAHHEYKVAKSGNAIYKASGTTADYLFEEKKIICSFVVELPGAPGGGKNGFYLARTEIPKAKNDAWSAVKSLAIDIVNGGCTDILGISP